MTQRVEEIYYEEKGRKPARFEDALETVVRLASESSQQEEWYPGKYAEQTVSRVLGKQAAAQTSGQDSQSEHQFQLSQFRLNPDTQAIFKQKLNEEYRITIPENERRALDCAPGDSLQVITYPVKSIHGEIIE